MFDATNLDKNCITKNIECIDITSFFSFPFSKRKLLNANKQGGLRLNMFFKKDIKTNPLISIITVVRNGASHIEKTIKSVLEQTYNNVEYIIIDGNSTDGTVEIIKKHDKYIDYWLSEPDRGIYSAMNKGVKLSRGSYIAILNADDVLYPETLSKISKIALKKDFDYTYGPIDVSDWYGNIFIKLNPASQVKFLKGGMPFPHPTMFISRSTYKKIGLYNEAYSLSADFDLTIRLIEQKMCGEPLPFSVGVFRMGGRGGGIKSFLESSKIMIRHDRSKRFAILFIFKTIYMWLPRMILPNFIFGMIAYLKRNSLIIVNM